MAFNTENQPKQAAALLKGDGRVSVYEATGGAVTSQFASHNLSLIPTILSNSIIHDNACGAGTVSRIILSSNPPSDLTITTTDTDQIFLDALQSDVTKNTWPITVLNMRAESLTFPDNHFTHSITNIGIFFTTSSGLDGAREIYRTLRPGGIAIVNCWQDTVWFSPFRRVHETLRPGKPYPQLLELWKDGSQIQKVMLDAGFKEKNMRIERSEAWAKTRDVRNWAEQSWAFLGGLPGWLETDEGRWDEAVDLLTELLSESGDTKVVGGEVWMKASQWVVVATK